jgi:hypothetical protein
MSGRNPVAASKSQNRFQWYIVPEYNKTHPAFPEYRFVSETNPGSGNTGNIFLKIIEKQVILLK